MQGRQAFTLSAKRILDRLRRAAGRLFVAAGRRRSRGAPQKSRSQARQLHKAMLAGFGTAAAKKLELLKVNRRPEQVGEAAWSLVLWYGSIGDYSRALDHLVMRRLAKRGRPNPVHFVLQVEALLKLGRFEDATKTIGYGIARLGERPELCFCAANAAVSEPHLSQPERDRLRLEWLNKPFVAAGLAPIELKDRSRHLDLDNIAVPSAVPHPRSGEAKISVLMPAHDAEPTIAYAMESVLNQTWTNLELIVVDDGSGDGTSSVIRSFAARDPRVVPLRHEGTRGAYPARNTALMEATGDFVTVNDADDWSHPQRLALQIIPLLDGDSPFNTTRMIRAHSNLQVVVKSEGATILENRSSLITRRETITALGGWDECRMGADDELYARFMLTLGAKRNVLYEGLPLAIAGARGESLTARPHVGIMTIHYGARREYKEAYRYWHRLEMSRAEPDLSISPGERRFPIPHICRLGPQRRINYDILFVSDYSLPGGTTSSNINMLRAAKALGLRCACHHWPRLDSAGNDVNPKVRELLHDGIAEAVVAGEEVRCKLVVAYHPPFLNQLPDRRVDVRTEACVVVVNQAPMSRTEDGRTMYDISNVLENAHAAFGVAAKLVPNSAPIRRMLEARTDPGWLGPVDWMPLIETATYRRAASSWSNSRIPIVGRHGRDHVDKWPSEPDLLRKAYCVGTSTEVRILGGAEGARRILGEIPANWSVLPFDSVDVVSFLRALDFFVYYPHEHLIEAFARTPIEAMAAGVPAILPPHFEELYADGAIYAEPGQVADTIHALWADKEAYEAQIRRGFDYVERTCSFDHFKERVQPYFQERLVAPKIKLNDAHRRPGVDVGGIDVSQGGVP